jgi:hypothetical protein
LIALLLSAFATFTTAMKPNSTDASFDDYCVKCDQIFSRNDSYKRHYLQFHKEDAHIVFPAIIKATAEEKKRNKLIVQQKRRQMKKNRIAADIKREKRRQEDRKRLENAQDLGDGGLLEWDAFVKSIDCQTTLFRPK